MAPKYDKDALLMVHNYLKKFNQHFSLQEFERLDFVKIFPIYRWLVLELTGCSENILYQPSFPAMNVFEHHDMHETSATVITLTLSIDYILEDSGFEYGFDVQDLFQPNLAKTVRILHHLCNFHCKRLERSAVVKEFKDQAEKDNEICFRLENENDQLKEQIAAARIRLAEEEQDLQQLKDRDAHLDDVLKEKQTAMRTQQKDSEQLEKEITDAQEKFNHDKETMERLREEHDRLDSQIVTSPERLTKELASLETEKDELAKEVVAAKTQAGALNERKAELEHKETQINSIMTSLGQILEEKEKLTDLNDEKGATAEKLTTLHSSVQGMIVKKSGKQKLLSNADTQLKNLEKQLETRSDGKRKEIGKLKENMEQSYNYKETFRCYDDKIKTIRHDVQVEEKEHQTYEELVELAFTTLKDQSEQQQEINMGFFVEANEEIEKELKKK